MLSTRARLITAGVLAAGVLAGCGSSTTTTTSSAAGTAASTSTPNSSTTGASAGPSGSGPTLTDVALGPTAIDAYSQIASKPLTGTGIPGNNGLQLGYQNADNSIRVEDDLFLEPTSDAAHTDYTGTVITTVKAQVSTVTDSGSAGLGDESEGFSGKTSTGKDIIAYAFRQGRFLCILLVESGSGPVDKTLAQSVVQKQLDRIKGAGG